MEYIWLVYLILALILFVYGLRQLVGFGWAMIIFDLLVAHTVSTNYAEAQKNKPPAKNQQTKILGLVCLLISLIFGYFAINSL